MRRQRARALVQTVTDEREAAESTRVTEARIEALARELAETINAGQAEGRDGLREAAVNVLRETVEVGAPRTGVAHGAATASFNPFGIGIPLVLMGSVLVFLFPPVGLLMFGAAAVMIAWGVGATLFARS